LKIKVFYSYVQTYGTTQQRGEIAAISRYSLIALLSMALKKYYITLTCSISFVTFLVLSILVSSFFFFRYQGA